MLRKRLQRLELEFDLRRPRKTTVIYVTDWAGNPLPIPEITGDPRDVVRIRYVSDWRNVGTNSEDTTVINDPDPQH